MLSNSIKCYRIFVVSWNKICVTRGKIISVEMLTSPLLTVAGPCYIAGDPMSYTGNLSVTTDGVQCEPWTMFPNEVENDFFPEKSVTAASNFCRNPGNTGKGPWCFSNNGSIGKCNVLMCSNAGRCQNCSLLFGLPLFHIICMPAKL